MKNIAIIASSQQGINLAEQIVKEISEAEVFSTREDPRVKTVSSLQGFALNHFGDYDILIFVGALGICVRIIASCLKNKKVDPAVINVDVKGRFVQSVVSGHLGGANEWTKKLARITGGQAVLSTTSDTEDIWSLDLFPGKYGWKLEDQKSLNRHIATFVNGGKTALLLQIRDQGTLDLESSCPSFVDVYYTAEDIKEEDYELIIAVTPFQYNKWEEKTLFFRPPILSLGVGCRKNMDPQLLEEGLRNHLEEKGLSWLSVAKLGSADIKKEEEALCQLAEKWKVPFEVFKAEELNEISIPNPSEKVFQTLGTYGVAEAAALILSDDNKLLVEKQKVCPEEGNDFTFSVGFQRFNQRKGFVEIVGAGPGDPELVSVKGKKFLEQADLILFAGSLVPEELTHYAKQGAVVRSSASMNLEEQVEIMKSFYDRGLLIVRLHTGDPCIYGAIQEQMALFDDHEMDYHITPGISSFQAAAAALKSQFTIPEKVQSIILTRGEGRTAMPEGEKLHELAKSQSTMCIFLSATLAEKVQKDLMVHYPPETPVAVCYKLTWREEKIWRGELQNLAKIIKENNLTLTTMIVVGEAIGNRKGLSRLYAHEFKHIFRK